MRLCCCRVRAVRLPAPPRAPATAGTRDQKLKTKTQLDEAFAFLQKGGKVSDAEFEAAAGVGVVVTAEQITAEVAAVVKGDEQQLTERRYRFPKGMLQGKVLSKLKFADNTAVSEALDAAILALLGPKTEEDNKKPEKKKAKKDKKPKAAGGAPEDAYAKLASKPLTSKKFHAVGENYTTDGYHVNDRTMFHMEQHKKAVGGRIHTRFPPEPNGILHIGHAKAINFNFSYAANNGGNTYLRYDDTNPEKEEKQFFDKIKEMVEWLGFKPFKVTHASDNFDKLHALAIKLIKKDLAYVCHQTLDEMRGENKPHSPYRNRPMAESLALFDDMKNGKIDEGKATLRVKHVMSDGKKDFVAYRVKFCEHHMSGDKWCIYPTYDFTHCLCDSIENITHSLCTKEFQGRRDSYYWLCNAVDVYCPVQWEYGRLNVTYTITSKRKIGEIIAQGHARSWDDPRLYTLTALRRRGFPPQAIKDFCKLVGVTENETTTEPAMLEYCVREVLNRTAKRAMAVKNPLKVEITNFPAGVTSAEVDDIPESVQKTCGVTNTGKHTVDVCEVVYIDHDDFREQADKDYKRLAVNQPVGLKYLGYLLTVTDVVKENGAITSLKATAKKLDEKPKGLGWIHWVSSASPSTPPRSAEVRWYKRLFPDAVPRKDAEGRYIVNNPSLVVYENAMVDNAVAGAKAGDPFQFEREGYFTVDPDTTQDKLVFNLTVELKGENLKDLKVQ